MIDVFVVHIAKYSEKKKYRTDWGKYRLHKSGEDGHQKKNLLRENSQNKSYNIERGNGGGNKILSLYVGK